MILQEFQDAITSIEKCARPVIAAVSGLCLGLGQSKLNNVSGSRTHGLTWITLH